jgi:hypothetical protein
MAVPSAHYKDYTMICKGWMYVSKCGKYQWPNDWHTKRKTKKLSATIFNLQIRPITVIHTRDGEMKCDQGIKAGIQ